MQSLFLLPFLLAFALLAACVETDISVPGFPQMMAYFSATEAQVQLTLSLNFLGFCLAGLFYGPLSDSFGRRPIMLIGNLIFLLAAIGTTTTTDINMLIIWRFLQGVGAAATYTIVFAIIADAYKGERASQLINRLNGYLTAVMAGAPMAGGIIVEGLGWRSTYGFVAVLCFFSMLLMTFFLSETNHHRHPFKPKQIIKDFGRLIADKDFISLTLGLSLQCAGYMAFVAAAVFVYIDQFQLSLLGFTLHQGCVIAAFSGVSFFGGQINRQIGSRTALLLGLIFNVFGAVGIWLLAVLGIKEALAFTSVMCLFSVGVALCYGVTTTASMELFPDHKGAAASLTASIRLLVISLAIWGVGVFANGTFIPETSLIMTTAMLAAILLGYATTKQRVIPLLC